MQERAARHGPRLGRAGGRLLRAWVDLEGPSWSFLFLHTWKRKEIGRLAAEFIQWLGTVSLEVGGYGKDWSIIHIDSLQLERRGYRPWRRGNVHEARAPKGLLVLRSGELGGIKDAKEYPRSGGIVQIVKEVNQVDVIVELDRQYKHVVGCVSDEHKG